MKQEYHIFETWIKQAEKECSDGNKKQLSHYEMRMLISQGLNHVKNLINLLEGEKQSSAFVEEEYKKYREMYYELKRKYEG